MSSTPHDGASDQSPWSQGWWIASAVIVGILAVLGVILALTGGQSHPPAGRVVETPQPARPAPAAAEPGSSTCGLPAGSQAVPASAPRARWELVGHVAAPTAPSRVGPGREAGGLRSCFAHSPMGALYASVNVCAMTAGSSSLRKRFVRRLVAPGIGRDRALASVQAGSGSGTDRVTTVQVAGFRVTDYRPQASLVDLALRISNATQATYAHIEIALAWDAGDWKLAMPATGDPFEGMAALDSLGGYVSWSGA